MKWHFFFKKQKLVVLWDQPQTLGMIQSLKVGQERALQSVSTNTVDT